MGTHIDAVRSYFNTQSVQTEAGNGDDQLVVRVMGPYGNSVIVTVIAEDDVDNVAVRVWGIAKVPPERRAEALETINQINNDTRWCFLYIDNDGDVMGAADAVVTPQTIGPVTYEVTMRSCYIMDAHAAKIHQAIGQPTPEPVDPELIRQIEEHEAQAEAQRGDA